MKTRYRSLMSIELIITKYKQSLSKMAPAKKAMLKIGVNLGMWDYPTKG